MLRHVPSSSAILCWFLGSMKTFVPGLPFSHTVGVYPYVSSLSLVQNPLKRSMLHAGIMSYFRWKSRGSCLRFCIILVLIPYLMILSVEFWIRGNKCWAVPIEMQCWCGVDSGSAIMYHFRFCPSGCLERAIRCKFDDSSRMTELVKSSTFNSVHSPRHRWWLSPFTQLVRWNFEFRFYILFLRAYR